MEQDTYPNTDLSVLESYCFHQIIDRKKWDFTYASCFTEYLLDTLINVLFILPDFKSTIAYLAVLAKFYVKESKNDPVRAPIVKK